MHKFAQQNSGKYKIKKNGSEEYKTTFWRLSRGHGAVKETETVVGIRLAVAWCSIFQTTDDNKYVWGSWNQKNCMKTTDRVTDLY